MGLIPHRHTVKDTAGLNPHLNSQPSSFDLKVPNKISPSRIPLDLSNSFCKH
ncbi:MAG: hypothetical protein AAF915_30400 [Cyanobacteria bacterium P01_D01_bin.50]